MKMKELRSLIRYAELMVSKKQDFTQAAAKWLFIFSARLEGEGLSVLWCSTVDPSLLHKALCER